MSTLRSRLEALRELRGPRELALFAYLTAFAALVPLMLRLPLPRLARLITRSPAAGTPTPERIQRLTELMPLAIRFAYPLVRPGCLTRGVTLFWFLRREGLDVELRFGLDPLDLERPDGHCWIALRDEPLFERDDPRPRFSELYRFPLAAT